MRRFPLLAPLRATLVVCAAAIVPLIACSSAHQEQIGSIEQPTITECPSVPMLEGVDVSHGEGTIDWVKVKAAGIDFAFIKATQGTYNTQATFAAQWSGAKAGGVARGPYHFFDPTEDGIAQANHFLSVVGVLDADDLPPALDLECPDGSSTCLGFAGGTGAATAAEIRQRMLDFMTTVQTATGKKPIVYTYGGYLTSNAVDTTGFTDYTLWEADPTTASCFTVPDPWKSAPLWQWSWTGTVDGITNPVDRDRFVGTLAQLHALGGDVAPDAGPSDAIARDAETSVGTDAGDVDAPSVDATGEVAVANDSALADARSDAPAGATGQGGGCGIARSVEKTSAIELAILATVALGRRRPRGSERATRVRS
ncbi:MAG: glycoside hydrolase family 25 protein [Polyangiales bacterium]